MEVAAYSTFDAFTDGWPTGLVGTLGVRIRNNAGTDVVARTISGIAVDPEVSGGYIATLVAPAPGSYEIYWDDPIYGNASDDLTVTYGGSTLPASSIYVELDALKASASLVGFSFADEDLVAASASASRAIDDLCSPKPSGGIKRRFYPDDDALQARYYTPHSHDGLAIDDLIELTSVKVDPNVTGAFDVTLIENTDFFLTPLNAALDDRPYERVQVHPRSYPHGGTSGAWPWPLGWPRVVQVTARFGWAATPDPIKEATGLLAARLVKRRREAPFGIVGGGEGLAIRIARNDPDIPGLIADYVRGGRSLG